MGGVDGDLMDAPGAGAVGLIAGGTGLLVGATLSLTLAKGAVWSARHDGYCSDKALYPVIFAWLSYFALCVFVSLDPC